MRKIHYLPCFIEIVYEFQALSTFRSHVCVLVIMDVLKNSFGNNVISKTSLNQT